MTAVSNSLASTTRRRWRLRFSLRTLLVVTALLSVVLGWIGSILVRVRQQRAVVAQIRALGGYVFYDYQLDKDRIDPSARPPGPKILRLLLGEDAFAYVGDVRFDRPQASEAGLKLLSELPELQTITLGSAKFTDAGMRHVAAVPKLRGLTLYDTSITGSGLARLRSARGLTRLTIFGDMVTDGMLQGISEVRTLETLQFLKPSITSGGLAHLRNLKRLRELLIAGAPGVGDDGLVHLTELRQLQRLWLSHCKITDRAVACLVKMPWLRSLDIRGCKISDHRLLRFASLRRLRSLTVGPDVTEEAAAKLRALIPDCYVEGYDKFSARTFGLGTPPTSTE